MTNRATGRVICIGLSMWLFIVLGAVSGMAGERTGTSTADAPRLQGEFVVHNPTNVTQVYQVKWGRNGKWDRTTLRPQELMRHFHPLAENGKAPSPFLRFDTRANDRQVTWSGEYDIDFGRVGYAGFGPRGQINEALHYEFRATGNQLQIVRRRG